MSQCFDTCQLSSLLFEDANTTEAAERLAGLLVDTPEFQNFLRLARAINLDQEVRELDRVIHSQEMYFDPDPADGPSLEALEAQLEALPLVRAYRQAEQTLSALFSAVNEVVSQAAGVAFAENARCAST